jgi:GNAT superfamily N-acetyltransferase
MSTIHRDQITIRNELQPGDIGYVTYLHGSLYAREYGYSVQFETYVAEGLCEFTKRYNPRMDRVWVCEHGGRIVGFLLVMERDDAAQLRYFLIEPEYRGFGLGSKLIRQCMDFIKDRGYLKAFLWTTHELTTAARLYALAGFTLTEEKESTAFGKQVRERRYDLLLRRT